MKYIDADKLKKAIEDKGLNCSFALKMERIDTLTLIDELQQEHPEVDLDFQTFAQNLDAVFALPAEETTNTNENPLNWEYAIARHFYELGLNARMEE